MEELILLGLIVFAMAFIGARMASSRRIKKDEFKNGTPADVKPVLGAVNSDPSEKGYYLTKTENDKWGIAYWDGNKFWDDPAQDGKLAFGIRRDFIKEWYLLPS